MLRDPITGDLDTDGIIQAFVLVALVCFFVSLAATTNGGSLVDPYFVLYDLAVEHAHITIASFMIILMASWWYGQFRGGYY